MDYPYPVWVCQHCGATNTAAKAFLSQKIRLGLARAVKNGKILGRPARSDYGGFTIEELSGFRYTGMTWNELQELTGVPWRSLFRYVKEFNNHKTKEEKTQWKKNLKLLKKLRDALRSPNPQEALKSLQMELKPPTTSQT